MGSKLSDIETLNKKVIRFEVTEGSADNVIDIDGRRVNANVYKYRKIWFESKKKEYLLCVTSKKDAVQGKLTLFSDKLQTIANFNHISAINLENLRDLIQI